MRNCLSESEFMKDDTTLGESLVLAWLDAYDRP